MYFLKMFGLGFSLLLTAEVALAQIGSFEGFSAAIGAGHNMTVSQLSTSYSPYANGQYAFGQGTLMGRADISYSLSVKNKHFLGLGISSDLRDSFGGYANLFYSEQGEFDSYIKFSGHRSIYIKPSFPISSQTLIYAKIGYHRIKNFFADPNGVLFIWGVSGKHYMSGPGISVGLAHYVKGNIFVGPEFSYVTFHRIGLGTADSGHLYSQMEVYDKVKMASAMFYVGYKL